jgi:cyclase
MLIETLAKRLVGVVTVRQGLAVQSFGYKRWLPLGRPEVLVENLDRWGADEILVLCIDRAGQGPDLALLDRLGALGLSTPLIYGGGIRDAAQAAAVVQRAADRIAVDALLHDEPSALRPIAERLGAQAVVAALPLTLDAGGGLSWLDHRSGRSRPLPEGLSAWWRDGLVSEALLIDWQHEGQRAGFDPRLGQAFDALGLPYIAFGGLSEPAQLRQQLLAPHCVAVAMGNFLSWREHAVQDAKRALQGLPLRAPAWAASAVPPCVPRLVSERVHG